MSRAHHHSYASTAPSGRAAQPSVPVDIHLWWAVPGEWAVTPDFLSILDPEEKRRLSFLLSPDDRLRYASAHVLARIVLAQRLGVRPEQIYIARPCPTCGQQHGKPHIAGSYLQFNLAHAGARVIVAVADRIAVGVDVEEVSGVGFAGFDEVALGEQETRTLHAQPKNRHKRARAVYWVRKEAILKASGLGLRVPPDQVQVSPPFEPASLLQWPTATSDFQLADIDLGPEYAAALAVATERPLAVHLVDAHRTLLRGW